MADLIQLDDGVMEKTLRAIGSFIYEFSQTEYTLRHCLSQEINLEEKLFSAVVQSYDVALLCNVAKQTFKLTRDVERFEEIEALINQFFKLNGERQRVAHGLWIPQFSGGLVHHVSRNTLQSKAYSDQADLLEKLAKEARQLRSELMRVAATYG